MSHLVTLGGRSVCKLRRFASPDKAEHRSIRIGLGRVNGNAIKGLVKPEEEALAKERKGQLHGQHITQEPDPHNPLSGF